MRIARKVVGPLATNCYILSCPETRKSVIIDPGGDPDLIKAFIEQTRLEPIEIISTHGHIDHIAGVADLKRHFSIGYAIHKDACEIVKLSVKEAPFWGTGMIEEPSIDRTLEPGNTITFGTVSGKILYTPGHSPGGISLLFDGLIIVGDTIFNKGIGRTDLYGGNFETLMNSIRTVLFALPDDTIVYSGHGQKTTIGEEKRENPFINDRF